MMGLKPGNALWFCFYLVTTIHDNTAKPHDFLEKLRDLVQKILETHRILHGKQLAKQSDVKHHPRSPLLKPRGGNQQG